MRKGAVLGLGLVVAILVALGLLILSSASGPNGLRIHHDQWFFFKRQILYLGVGLAIAGIIANIDYHIFREHKIITKLCFIAVFFLLLAVFLYPPINGSHRWLKLGPISLQPSEFAKLVTVLVLAVWFDHCCWKVTSLKHGLIIPGAIVTFLIVPVILEPDFGSTMVIVGLMVLLMLIGGTKILHLVVPTILGVAAIAVVLYHNENRMRRLFGFFGPRSSDDPSFYQSAMSMVAIRNGHIYGLGFGESMQKHAYLPEAHTDFIFSVGAEEFGVIFSITTLTLFALFFIISMIIACKAKDRFGRYLVVGMGFLICTQAIINLCVVCGSVPAKGMALPFFSYGGTSLISSLIATGVILSVAIHSEPKAKKKRKLSYHR